VYKVTKGRNTLNNWQNKKVKIVSVLPLIFTGQRYFLRQNLKKTVRTCKQCPYHDGPTVVGKMDLSSQQTNFWIIL